MSGELKLGDFVVAKEKADSVERAIVNKYTLVPVGAVIAAVVITFGVTRSIMSERERILILETKVETLEMASDEYGPSLRGIRDDLIRIKIKLGIEEGAASRSTNGNEKAMAVEDNVGRGRSVNSAGVNAVRAGGDGG